MKKTMCVSDVVAMIENISSADLSSEKTVDKAYCAYCSLDKEKRGEVTNIVKLTGYREDIAKLYNSQKKQGPRINRAKVNIGTYCFNKQCWNDDGVRALRDAGIDFLSNAANDKELLALLEKYGIGAFVAGVVPGWYSGGDRINAGKMSEMNPLSAYDAGMKSFEDRECIWGIDIGDEPDDLDFPHYGKVFDYLTPAFPNQLLYLNLLPALNQYYENHIRKYAEEVKADYICYDHYIWGWQERSREGNVEAWLNNIHIVQQVSRELGRDLWIVIQASSNHDIPLNEEEIRVSASLSLTFGARVLSWACWSAGWFNYHVVDDNGNLNEVYYYIKKVNEEVSNLSPVYMRYDCVKAGYIAGNSYDLTKDKHPCNPCEKTCEKLVPDSIENCSISVIEADDDSVIIAGYFEKKLGGGSAVMITNISDYYCRGGEGRQRVTFTLKNPDACVSAYYNGEAAEIENLGDGKYSAEIGNSDNLFVVIE